MIEIECPSCQARYRLPDGAVGDAGRKVSCSSCGHGWVAYSEPPEAAAEAEAPLTLGPEAMAGGAETVDAGAAEAGPAGVGGASGHAAEMGGARPAVKPLEGQGKTYNPYAAYDDDETQSGTSPYADEEDRGMAAYEAFARTQEEDEAEDADGDGEFSIGPSTGKHDKLAEDRATQMEQIRSLLNEIKETPATTITPAEEDEEDEDAYAQAARPTAVERSLAELEAEERDPLRAKLEEFGRPKKIGDVKANRNKMLKKHAKKVRRRKMEEAKGSGTFTTGFLLVVMIVAIMVSVYLLSDVIIAKAPESEPAIRDYVATMDQFRIWAAEQIGAARAWVESMIEGK